MQPVGRSFNIIWSIFKHELRLFFVSPIAYLVGAGWFFFAALFFTLGMWSLHNPGFGSAPPSPSMVGTLHSMMFLTLFFAPALTMRLVAEEIHAGTHELLLTSPVRDWEIIVAKWLAAWAVATIFILFMLIFPLILLWRGNPDPGLMAAGYIGFWLWAGAAIAIGILSSSLTQYQLVALMIGEGIALLLYLGDVVAQIAMGLGIFSEVFSHLSVRSHYLSMIGRGLIDLTDVVYFLGLTAISLFLATQILSMRRWRS